MVTTNPIISSTKNVRFEHGGQLLLSPIKKLHFYLERANAFIVLLLFIASLISFFFFFVIAIISDPGGSPMQTVE